MENSIEKWLPVVGYEGSYSVSNEGRVKSMAKKWFAGVHNRSQRSKGETLLRQHINRLGYVKVNMHGIEKPRIMAVHRLVATAFIPNPENKPEVNHKDGNKGNNHVSNLEWATLSENRRHAYSCGLTRRPAGDLNPNSHKRRLERLLQ